MSSALPNTPMLQSQLTDLITLANSNGSLLHKPFELFVQETTNVLNDRGAWVPGTFDFLDKVTDGGYDFVCLTPGTTDEPLDPVTGEPSANWAQPWYSVYQRIRDEANRAANLTIAGALKLARFQQSVSGPWPITDPDISYDQLAFYYEETGNSESVSLTGTVIVESFGLITVTEANTMINLATIPGTVPQVGNDQNLVSDTTDPTTGVETIVNDAIINGPSQKKARYVSACEFEFEVGGNQAVPINVTFTCDCLAIQGIELGFSGDGITGDEITFIDNPDATTDPTTLVTIDTSNWFGGASFTGTFLGYHQYDETAPGDGGVTSLKAGTVRFSCTINATVSPGSYKVKFTSATGPNYSAAGTFTETDDPVNGTTFSGSNTWQMDSFAIISETMIGEGTMGITSSTSVEVPGVDDSKRIFKIDLPTFSSPGFPVGLIGVWNLYQFLIDGTDQIATSVGNQPGFTNTLADITGSSTSLTDLVFKFVIYQPGTAWVITSSVNGYWFGKTPPIQSLGILAFEKMQWNKFPVDHANSDAQTNTFLGYKIPYTGGFVTNSSAQRAYDATDSPNWLPASNNMEMLPWPKRWKAQTHYPKDWSIIDSYGNLQIVVVPSAGEGRSGATEPLWGPGKVIGTLTTEPLFHGFLTRTEPGVVWKLQAILRVAPNRKLNSSYKIGDTIIDDNGNIETSITTWTGLTGYTSATLVDSNNNQQTVVTPGTSGATEPTWSTVIGGLTTDGSVVWSLTALDAPASINSSDTITWPTTLGDTVMDGHVKWKLTQLIPKLTPAVARITPPVYPFFWQNNPSTELPPVLTMPTTDSSGKHIFDFQTPTSERGAPGLGDRIWIYRVAINRLGKKENLGVPPAGSIPVTIGCVRNGSFVAFGTYSTGEIIDVMWSVFTNTALAIQSAERVDIQAEFITCGASYSVWGTVTYPMCAAYLNDVTAILGLLP